jgi:8-oxo-dGTP pyrophosphatase MutT (NUDIX family)
MNFQDLFYSRLQSLCARETQEFPQTAFPAYYRTAAVLLPFWPEQDGTVKLAFTRRADSLPSHQGQVSFPGGSRLPQDGSTEQTALREANEELGVDPGSVMIMGRLDDAWSGFGFHIIPYVGWISRQPEFRPDYHEVADILIADVETLMRPESSALHTVGDRTTHAYTWEGGYVWGLTADILLELLLWVRGEPSNRRDVRLAYMLKQLGKDN